MNFYLVKKAKTLNSTERKNPNIRVVLLKTEKQLGSEQVTDIDCDSKRKEDSTNFSIYEDESSKSARFG